MMGVRVGGGSWVGVGGRVRVGAGEPRKRGVTAKDSVGDGVIVGVSVGVGV
jgi:hypothetical protein